MKNNTILYLYITITILCTAVVHVSVLIYIGPTWLGGNYVLLSSQINTNKYPRVVPSRGILVY